MPDPAQKPQFVIEPLGTNHDRAAFSCGTEPLDRYLRQQARQDMKKNLAAVFVLTPDGQTIAGYYTLSAYTVRLDEIPGEIARKLTRMPEVPTTLIGRLARSTNFLGQGIGELLLFDALKRSFEKSKEIASWAVIVDAKDANAANFYKKYGSLEIPATPQRLFLPMSTIAQLDFASTEAEPAISSSSSASSPSSSASSPSSSSPSSSPSSA